MTCATLFTPFDEVIIAIKRHYNSSAHGWQVCEMKVRRGDCSNCTKITIKKITNQQSTLLIIIMNRKKLVAVVAITLPVRKSSWSDISFSEITCPCHSSKSWMLLKLLKRLPTSRCHNPLPLWMRCCKRLYSYWLHAPFRNLGVAYIETTWSTVMIWARQVLRMVFLLTKRIIIKMQTWLVRCKV